MDSTATTALAAAVRAVRNISCFDLTSLLLFKLVGDPTLTAKAVTAAQTHTRLEIFMQGTIFDIIL